MTALAMDDILGYVLFPFSHPNQWSYPDASSSLGAGLYKSAALVKFPINRLLVTSGSQIIPPPAFFQALNSEVGREIAVTRSTTLVDCT
jgi:hypothetical protein